MKKKVNKKILSVFMMCVMLSIILPGCSDNNSSEEVTTITVYTSESHSKTVVDKLIYEFNKGEGAKAGIHIDYNVRADNAKMIELGAANGELPDLFTTGNMETMISEDLLAAIEDLPDGQELIDARKDYMLEKIHTFEGKTYRLPFSVTTRGLIYNKDMFKEAGIVDENGEAKPPRTYKELREYAKILTDSSKHKYGLVVPIGWAEQSFLDSISPMSCASTGYIEGYNVKTGNFDYSVFDSAIETILDMKHDGSIMPGAESLSNDAARARFAEGNIGMKFAYSFDAGVLNTQFPAQIDWGVAPIPVENESEAHYQPYNVNGFLAINKASVEKKGADKIMAAYKFLHSDEFLIECYKEGVYIPYNYNLIEDVEFAGDIKGWEEFAKMLEISTPQRTIMKYNLPNGVQSISKRWVDEIWPEKTDFKTITKEMTETVNQAAQDYRKQFPYKDYSVYIDENYDTKR